MIAVLFPHWHDVTVSLIDAKLSVDFEALVLYKLVSFFYHDF